MKSEPGTYALILKSNSRANVQIGRWGELAIKPGFYIYVGSARGPGGVKARVLRHFRATKPKHWHIDYLRKHVTPVCAWYLYGSKQIEHDWAQAFADMANTSSVKNFGCSDCKCGSHLFSTSKQPNLSQFTDSVGTQVELWEYQSESELI